MRGKGVGGADGVPHGAEIAWTATPKRKPRKRAGEIGDGLQRAAQVAPQTRLIGKIGHRIETRIHRRRIGQGTAEPACQFPRPRRGHGAIDGGEQAAGARALARPHQLEIGARGGVDDEEAAGAFLARRTEQRRPAGLGDLHIGEQPGECGKLRLREFAKGVERGHAETGLQRPLAADGVEMSARARRERGARFLDLTAKHRVAGDIVAEEHLPGPEPGKLARKIARAHRRSDQLAGRDIERSESVSGLAAFFGGRPEQRGEEIVGAGIEQGLLGEGAGRDEADHVAAHHRLGPAPLGLGRIFDLLAHRHPVALGDQALEIVVGGMDRHAAHGNVLAQMLAAFGERDPERARGDFGVLEEQLVEIAHAVKQQAVGVGRLDLQILGDHGRGERHLLLARSARRGGPCEVRVPGPRLRLGHGYGS